MRVKLHVKLHQHEITQHEKGWLLLRDMGTPKTLAKDWSAHVSIFDVAEKSACDSP